MKQTHDEKMAMIEWYKSLPTIGEMRARRIAAESEKISVSKGNRKMGRVPSVSLPPVVTCAPRVPCSIADADGRTPCYVVANIYRGPYGARVSAAYDRNLRILTASRSEFFRQLHAYIKRTRPEFFRFHVSGDWVNRAHMRAALGTARAFPAVRFMAFSKRLSWFPVASTVPRNFSLIASLWPNWGKRPRGYRVAYMDDGNETRITRRAIACLGNCETCAMCFHLPSLRRDVVFKKH